MNWLESILYALVSGFAEFLPVSSQAHRAILLCLFGQDREFPLMGLFIRIGMIAALIISNRIQLQRLYSEYTLARIPKRRRRRFPDLQCLMDISLLKTACIPLLLGFLLYPTTSQWSGQLYIVALLLIVNGMILHIPAYLPRGNKDSRSMSRLDAMLIGLSSATAVLPGISRVGTSVSVATARGADVQQAYKWSLLLSLPSLTALLCFDLFYTVTASYSGVGFWTVFMCILAGCAAFLGTYCSVFTMRFLVQRSGLSGFSYYCWGAALFAFILYLI